MTLPIKRSESIQSYVSDDDIATGATATGISVANKSDIDRLHDICIPKSELDLPTDPNIPSDTPIEERPAKTIKDFFISIGIGIGTGLVCLGKVMFFPVIFIIDLIITFYNFIASIVSKNKQQEELTDNEDNHNILDYSNPSLGGRPLLTPQTEASSMEICVEVHRADSSEDSEYSFVDEVPLPTDGEKTQEQHKKDKEERDKAKIAVVAEVVGNTFADATAFLGDLVAKGADIATTAVDNLSKLSTNDKIEIYRKFFNDLDKGCFYPREFIQLIDNRIKPFEHDLIIGLKVSLNIPEVTKDQVTEKLENIITKAHVWLENNLERQGYSETEAGRAQSFKTEQQVKKALSIYESTLYTLKQEGYDFEKIDQNTLEQFYLSLPDFYEYAGHIVKSAISSASSSLYASGNTRTYEEHKIEEHKINCFRYLFDRLKEDSTKIVSADLDCIMVYFDEDNFVNELTAMLKIYDNSTEVTTDQVIDTLTKLTQVAKDLISWYREIITNAISEFTDPLEKYIKIYQQAHDRLKLKNDAVKKLVHADEADTPQETDSANL